MVLNLDNDRENEIKTSKNTEFYFFFLLPEDLRDFFFLVLDWLEPKPLATFLVWRVAENNEACFCFLEN